MPAVEPGWRVVELLSTTVEQEYAALMWAFKNVTDWKWNPYLGRGHDDLGLHFQFKNLADALLFKLTWGGNQ